MKKTLAVILFVVFLIQPLNVIVAEEASDIDKRIEELQKKIDSLQEQENTLSKQISILNSQISLTTLKIDSIRSAIAKLVEEIERLEEEIDKLELLMTHRSALFLRRIPESYKRSVANQFGMVFFSNNFSEFLSRVKYISIVQQKDAELLVQLKATQNTFSDRKLLREEKRQEQESLKKQLEGEMKRLDLQKREKQSLLDQTRNDESTYQTLLAQALAEKQALERAIIEGVKVGEVKKDAPIALVGNTGYPGCSTGPHLHFEIRKDNAWVNVEDYLKAQEVTGEQGGKMRIGVGDWDWPLKGTVIVTQRFGRTPFSWRYAYSGGIHTGIDMVSSDSVIYAPRDGTLYSSSQICGGSSVIKIKYIDHGGGLISFYLHVQ